MNRALIISETKKIARSRSLLIFGILFSVLLVTIISVQLYAIPATTSFTRFSASFLNVILFLLPLFTLAIGALSISSDVESRWISLLRTYPMKGITYTFGKFIALVFSFSFMLVIGYGLVLIIHAFLRNSVFDYLLLIISFIAIAIFSAISILVGSLSESRIHSLSLALGVWAFFLLIYDYILMAIGTVASGTLLKNLVVLLTLTNPVEWLRVGYILYSGNSTVLGPVYFGFSEFFLSPLGIIIYVFLSCLWVAIPVVSSGQILYRREGR